MQWIILVSLSILISQTLADPNPVPEPKKYRPEKNEKPYKISEDERKFIKEIESKYNINQGESSENDDTSEEKASRENSDSEVGDSESQEDNGKPFPAVIAIEIVNDTVAEGKGKRTIDANLGYGYRTNKGYTYTYLGKPKEEQGKFMIYPYSQEDIPAAHSSHGKNNGRYQTQSRHRSKSPNVEIQPSKAYELVPVTDEQTSYGNERAISEVQTKYEHVTGVESPPPPQPSTHYRDHKPQITSTLFSTYNEGKISGLSGNFPSVMPNYLIDSSQLLADPQFQNVGITSDHLRQHGEQLSQRVVPVLILRIPSSHIQNPTAELYPNLPQNYPYSNHLNNINIQSLVAQYLRKHGYTHQARQEPSEGYGVPLAPTIKNYPVHYTTPAVQNPSYTHTNFGGVQYSAVQPVMAKYPTVSNGAPTQYYAVPETSQGAPETEYRYVQGSTVGPTADAHSPPEHSVNPMYQQYLQQESLAQNNPYHVQQEEVSHTEYASLEAAHQSSHSPSSMYLPVSQYSSAGAQVHRPSAYELTPITESSHSHTKTGSPHAQTHSYHSGASHHFKVHHDVPTAHVPGQEMYVTYAAPSHQAQQHNVYQYVQQIEHTSDDKHLPISENYPSKDHTQVTILPKGVVKQSKIPVQQVTYVTPSPSQNKFHPYRMMAPQSVLGYKSGVSYINSHSLPQSQYSHEYLNPEKEHTTSLSYLPPVGSQKPPSYPRNYHAHGNKRMTKPENKTRVQVVRKIVPVDKKASSHKS